MAAAAKVKAKKALVATAAVVQGVVMKVATAAAKVGAMGVEVMVEASRVEMVAAVVMAVVEAEAEAEAATAVAVAVAAEREASAEELKGVAREAAMVGKAVSVVAVEYSEPEKVVEAVEAMKAVV